jgi:hypothetical protein
MLKVWIKYCGGCNPGYDRVALADYVRKSLHGRVEFVSLGSEGIDLVLAVEGCSTCCTDLSPFKGKPIHFISRIEDAGRFLQKILG